MANIKSALKRVRQAHKRRLRNRYKLITTRNLIKELRSLTERTAAEALWPKVESQLDRLAKHNIIHRNNAANQKSKLRRFVNKLA
ncbi:MAG: 30S ribosomal protein S20 [Bacteroidia bacterium]|nr:30S ribosomal protein S20 [Bacteroidia bacterium]